MLKIAFLSNGIYPFVVGGMQKHAYYLIKYFLKNNIHITLYHPLIKDKKTLQNVFEKDLTRNLDFKEIHSPKLLRFPGHYVIESYLYSKRIFNHLKNKNYDFIYAKSFSAWYTLNNKKYIKAPIGIQLHGLEMFQSNNFSISNKLLKYAALKNLKKSDYIFSYGGKIKELLLKLNVGSPEKIINQHGGVEKQWIKSFSEIKNQKERTFIFIGRFEKRKGLVELNSVLRNLIEEYNFKFYFIGNIPAPHQITSEKCIYLGIVKELNKYQEYIDHVDCIVVPSLSEGLPTVILECMARGLTCIATDVGAINEVVNSTNGWIFPPKNIHALESALKEILTVSDDELLKKKSEAIKTIEENYCWTVLIKKLIIFIKGII